MYSVSVTKSKSLENSMWKRLSNKEKEDLLDRDMELYWTGKSLELIDIIELTSTNKSLADKCWLKLPVSKKKILLDWELDSYQRGEDFDMNGKIIEMYARSMIRFN